MLEKSGAGQGLYQTSVFEIHNDSQIPLDKIVIGKPTTLADAGGAYMNGTYLGTCIQGATQQNWSECPR